MTVQMVGSRGSQPVRWSRPKDKERKNEKWESASLAASLPQSSHGLPQTEDIYIHFKSRNAEAVQRRDDRDQ